jgi:hypothetical protein
LDVRGLGHIGLTDAQRSLLGKGMPRVTVQNPGELGNRGNELTLVVVGPGQVHADLHQTRVGGIREKEALEYFNGLVPIPRIEPSGTCLEEFIGLEILVFGRRGTTTQESEGEEANDDFCVSCEHP